MPAAAELHALHLVRARVIEDPEVPVDVAGHHLDLEQEPVAVVDAQPVVDVRGRGIELDHLPGGDGTPVNLEDELAGGDLDLYRLDVTGDGRRRVPGHPGQRGQEEDGKGGDRAQEEARLPARDARLVHLQPAGVAEGDQQRDHRHGAGGHPEAADQPGPYRRNVEWNPATSALLAGQRPYHPRLAVAGHVADNRIGTRRQVVNGEGGRVAGLDQLALCELIAARIEEE